MIIIIEEESLSLCLGFSPEQKEKKKDLNEEIIPPAPPAPRERKKREREEEEKEPRILSLSVTYE